MPKLTTNQLELLTAVCGTHRTQRTSALIRTGSKYVGYHPKVLKSLLDRGLIRHVGQGADVRGRDGLLDYGVHEVELTSAGWDVFYRIT